MLYVKGWPTRMLSDAAADRLADARAAVSGLLGLDARYLDRVAIHGRYAELLAARTSRAQAA